MSKHIRIFQIFTLLLVFIFIAELGYFSYSKGITSKELDIKKRFVREVGLPDLSIATEARFIRFRSLSDVYSPFNEGPEILDYFPVSFTYYPSLKEGK